MPKMANYVVARIAISFKQAWQILDMLKNLPGIAMIAEKIAILAATYFAIKKVRFAMPKKLTSDF